MIADQSKKITSFPELIEAKCFGKSTSQTVEFFEAYPKNLMKQLRDLLMQIEKQVRLLENWHEASVSTLEHFSSLKVSQV